MDWTSIASIVFAIVLIVAIIILYRKNIINEEYLDCLTNYLDQIDDGDGLVAVLAKYAEYAVRAVEQMVKAGVIPKENEPRKNKAIEIVEECANADGIMIDDNDIELVGNLIEAEVSNYNYW